jgi:(2Fe-2S) ferredoxin
MAPPYAKHIFVCTNRRPDGSPRGCCASKGGDELRLALKREIDALGLVGMRANGAGCLDSCERGISMCVYPDNVWYGPVTVDDVKEIVREHLKNDRVVERLVMAPILKTPKVSL